MAILPKTLLKWKEDGELRKQLRPKMSLRTQLLAISAWIVTLMLLRWMALAVPGRNPPPWPIALAIALPASLFFVYGIPWINGICPSQVWLMDNQLILAQGQRQIRLPWSAIASYSWGKHPHKTRMSETFDVLRVTDQRGQQLILSAPDASLRPEVDAIMTQKSVTRIDS